ncbi:hypothetical protein BJ138DRAFT_945806 [Hygrophoropsis aurantiaca]|uniref:Uncharacterized protein n=1 Tax=Hygrophoropsis aurantiaca TaxID=72124 RepID=A0ACB7ZTH7_9AGAM|nr:hypothetical protein BJ138DRAFT_945806 [Hygrophoropsis aurantiaca]
MGDSAIIQVLQTEQITHYLTAAGGALVAYDQVQTFAQEVDHIWNQNWSFTTALYLIARYAGSLSVIGRATCKCNIFILTMQAILVFRVYALFNQSKRVLLFLVFYALQATAEFVMMGFYLNSQTLHEFIVSISPAYGSVSQNVNIITSAFLHLAQGSTILSVVFDSVLLFFALWAFVRHALEAKTLNGGWSISVLVRTLVADHLVYFVCYLTWVSLSLATNYITDELNVSNTLLDDILSVFNALGVVAGPRVILSLRAVNNKPRREDGTLEGEVTTIRFGTRGPPTQAESAIEEGGGL